MKNIKMQKTIIICAAALTLLISCGEKKSSSDTGAAKEAISTADDNSGKSATFKVDGTEYKGKVETQHFAGDGFSVLCQQDEPFALLQAVFANEKEASGTAYFKPSSSFYGVSAGDVNVALTMGDEKYNTTDKSTGIISVEEKKLILKDLKLFDSNKKEKIITSTLPF